MQYKVWKSCGNIFFPMSHASKRLLVQNLNLNKIENGRTSNWLTAYHWKGFHRAVNHFDSQSVCAYFFFYTFDAKIPHSHCHLISGSEPASHQRAQRIAMHLVNQDQTGIHTNKPGSKKVAKPLSFDIHATSNMVDEMSYTISKIIYWHKNNPYRPNFISHCIFAAWLLCSVYLGMFLVQTAFFPVYSKKM